MGNNATKEQRPSTSRLRSVDAGQASLPTASAADPPPSLPPQESHSTQTVYNVRPEVRTGRGSRPDLSTLLGIRNGPPSDAPTLEHRRASKQEREAKKLELERVAREKERERSMREEHVDGGYLVTQGVYIGPEDYNKSVVRQLTIERRIAPFWRGLNDHSDSWTENQLVAAARGRAIPAPDAIPEEEPISSPEGRPETRILDTNVNGLTVPITSRSQSFNSDTSSNMSPSQASFPPNSMTAPPPSTNSGSTLFRGRAKTLAALTTSSKNSATEIVPREMQLPKDSFVSGQPIEAYLYKDASECPICFLYYPPYLNKTRCCDQSICSECFVQIKRPDPHPPEHTDPTAPPAPSTEDRADPEELVSEPAACPFCVQPEFGITYEPPPFRRGLTYVNHHSSHPVANVTSAMSSASSLASAMSGRLSPTGSGRRRATSISATSPLVISTDKVRPDWHQKLAAARAHTARRSAAATALHTAAYLMGNRQEPDGRSLGSLGRRGILRRTSGADSSSGTNSSQLNMLAMMSERYAAANPARDEEGEPSMTPGPRGSSRRHRVDDLEDMMMMEAIRLSLAAEDERRKRDEKDEKKGAKKEQKKKEKEVKKAEKAARKAGVYSGSANPSTTAVSNHSGDVSTSQGDIASFTGKGKGAEQHLTNSPANQPPNAAPAIPSPEDAQDYLERARAQILPSDAAMSSLYSSPPYKPSHLRTLSNASSSASSFEGSHQGSLNIDHHAQSPSNVSPNASGSNISSTVPAQDAYISGTAPAGPAGTEPMFNFRSLAAMVGNDDKSEDSTHESNSAGFMDAHSRQSSVTQANSVDQGSTTKAMPGDTQPHIDSLADQNLQTETNLPNLNIKSPSRNDLGLEVAGEASKRPAVEVENVVQQGPQTSS